MSHANLTPALALVAAGIVVSGLALAPVTAQAAIAHDASALSTPGPHPGQPKPLTSSRLAQVRERESRLAAQHRTAPLFAEAGSKTLTVNTTEDSPLADPAGTTCVDASTGTCSLRAATEAANNLDTAVKIVLGTHTYSLTTGSTLMVTNPQGVSVVGRGSAHTAIAGDGSGIFDVTASDPSVRAGGLFLTSLKLENGTSVQGGAVQLEGSGVTLTLDRVTATHNTASNAGGAICSSTSAGIYISHSRLTHNHALQGGALFEFWSTVEISDSSFDHNSSPAGFNGFGGAVYNNHGVFDMSGGSISGNIAGDASRSGVGGAIFNIALARLTNVHVDHNSADHNGVGGAIYGDSDDLEIDHGTMSHNHAHGVGASGGAIFTSYQSTLAVHGVTMAGNRAGGTGDGDGGGAIYAYGAGYPTQVIIDAGSKITGSNGSAVYLYNNVGGVDASISDSTLADNASTVNNGMHGLGCGGAVCAYAYQQGGLNLAMHADQITGNSSIGNGGAGAVTTYADSDTSASVVLRKNTFSGNRSGASGLGGAVGFYSNGVVPISVRMAFNTFTANRVGAQGSASKVGRGGALFALSGVTITDKGSVFTHNRAIGDDAVGGAVADFGFYGSATFTRSTFTGNSAGTNKATNTGYGGAFYAFSARGTAFDRVTMSGNTASSSGGGLYAEYGANHVKVTDSTISGNTAGTSSQGGEGGGVFINSAASLIENSTLTGNRATSITGTPGKGGAVFYDGPRFALHYSTVSGNYAMLGGGVYGDTYGSVVGSILSQNWTSSHGSEQDCGVESSMFRLVSIGGSVLGQKSCVVRLQTSDKVSRTPRLGKLENNGGPTKTMAISAKSPAVGRATYLVPMTDQRGHDRPSNHVDAGAYELARPKEHHH